MSVPSSVIHILRGVPLNNSYEHSLYFETREDQYEYFHLRRCKTFDKFTYLRPENKIKVAGDIANAQSWNYLMFQNSDGKWFYHFIDKVTYLSDNSVELHITLDVIQTYMFDWELNECFIERMHTESDEFGEHTIPEGLETGPLVEYGRMEINLEDNVILVMLACDEDGADAWGRMYGGVYSGLNVYAVLPSDVTKFNVWLNNASSQGFVDAIVSMWMYPKELVTVSDNWSTTNTLHKVSGVSGDMSVLVDDPLTGATALGSHVVMNKKTFCYPYTMMYVSNNMGGCATFHRERFKNPGEYEFRVYGALAPDSGVQLIPKGYKTTASKHNFEEALSHPAFPTCAWNSDTYKVWLAQNQNQLDNSMNQAKIQATVGGVSAIAGIIGSAASMNMGGMVGSFMAGGGAILNAYQQTQTLMAQQRDMMVQPDQARGNHSGNINLTHARMGYTVYFLGLSSEYAQSIDDYFTRYGYKLNIIEKPKLRTREKFTYIKTVGCLVTSSIFTTGGLGTEAQLQIQAIFDKGITFWADPSCVGRYYMSNKPIKEV